MESDVRKPNEDTQAELKWKQLKGEDNIWVSEEGTFYEGTSILEKDPPLNVVIEIITLEKVKPALQKELSQLEKKVKKDIEIKVEEVDGSKESDNSSDETEEIFSCSICYEEFKDEKDLQHHNLSHLVVQPETFSCEHCDKTFVRKEQLQRHRILKSHLTTSDNEKEKDHLKCNICSARFSNNLLLDRHIKSHKEIFQCTICSREFAHLKSLKNHLRIHK